MEISQPKSPNGKVPKPLPRYGWLLGVLLSGLSIWAVAAQEVPSFPEIKEIPKDVPKLDLAPPAGKNVDILIEAPKPDLAPRKDVKEKEFVFPPIPQVMPLGPNSRLPLLADAPRVLGNTPRPSQETVQRYEKYVKEMIDPEMTLDLISGRTRLMILKQLPKRIQIADDSVAGYTLLAPNEISLLGRNVGITVLTFWFADPKVEGKQSILTYYVRVLPDPEARERLERVYKALTEEINRAFPDSVIQLQLVGDKLVVSGHAKDVTAATHILRIVRANAPVPGQRGRAREAAQIPVDRQRPEPSPNGSGSPGLDNYEVSENTPHIVNLIRINGEQQVMLRVTVAEVNRSAARSIGLNFALMNRQGQTLFANATGNIVTGGLTSVSGGVIPGLNTLAGSGLAAQGAGGFNNLPAMLDNGRIALAISALRDLNYARSLAEPNLVTLNGQPAQFQAGGQFPVPIVSASSGYGLQGVNFVPYGVQLNFTPFITDRDRVRLVISAEVSARDLAAGSTNIGGTLVPTLSTRNFRTTVELREGQTLAVAGLIQNNLGADSKRIPFLGDLPILGRAFSFDRLTAGDQELVVLITPELVHPLNPKEVPPLPGSDLFEPTDLEFYLHGRLESHHRADYRSTVRTDWQRLRDYRKVERIYLSGPSGPVDEPR